MTIATGRVLQVSVSPGGVPKLPVEGAWVGTLGLDGDKHREYTVHGGPDRAVCLFAMEAIERLQAEGHPIVAGGAGENLTTSGIEWSLLPIGATIRVGEALEMELSASTTPCSTQTGNFSDGNFNRILIDRHPSDSRMYARVLHEGNVAPGDLITVQPPAADSTAADQLLARRFDRAEGKSTVAAWRAARDAGFEITYVEDGEIAMASSKELPGPAFNQAHGFAGLPNLVAEATSFYDRHGTQGWIWAKSPPWEGAVADLTLDLRGARPDEIADISAPVGVVIRRVGADDGYDFASVKSGNETAGGMAAGASNPWPRVMAQLAKTVARQIFIAEIDGKPVAEASLHITAKTGWLRGAVVALEARGRGIQRALIAARARAAAEAGCDLIGASAEPGVVSAINLEKTGMRAVVRRSMYAYDPNAQRMR